MKIISAGGIVINDKDQIILVRERKGSWGFPKGHIEKGESELAAAEREIYEETGARDLRYIEELGTLQHMKPGFNEAISKTNVKFIKIFLFKCNQEDLNPIDPQNPEARWFNINKVLDVLKYKEARTEEDEKHVHPLQLDVINRIVVLRSNPGEVVFTPFMGVGSEVYGALINGRKGIGVELKKSYFNQATKNINSYKDDLKVQKGLFD